MTEDQITQLLTLLSRIAENVSARQYTISGAADWPLLLVGFAVLAAMWRDLKVAIKDYKSEWMLALQKHKEDDDKAHDLIWAAHRECQDDCCPRGKG